MFLLGCTQLELGSSDEDGEGEEDDEDEGDAMDEDEEDDGEVCAWLLSLIQRLVFLSGSFDREV